MSIAEPAPGVIAPRPAVAALPSYAAGKPPKAAEGLTPFKLSSNENPLGPVPAAAEAAAAVQSLHRYPNPAGEALRTELAGHFEVPYEDIVTGTGSLGALTQIISTFAGTGEDGTADEVIYAWRSFEAYPIVVRTAGAKDVPVPVTAEGRHDLEAMLAVITERTRVILLCTPNNPTGPALTHTEVTEFLTKVPGEVVVVVDEAYLEFVRSPDPVDGLALYRQFPNVAVLRTFSKAHGLAGLRVGYSIAQQSITQHLRKTAVPFGVSAVAEAAAVASLRHLDQVHARVEELVGERQKVTQALAEAGWRIPETQANFVWLPLGTESLDFAQAAGVQALAVRPFAGEGVRVSIGEPEANDRFIALCRTYSGPAGVA
ncbi:histidinol-phosphate transaminase [Nesterenkonia alkaliphila]|uniref:Aromatic amino acid aminotransferase n=1 Tax=Nesterenkonia alkaliphila TaxID=1463631 RepID=A0A7K1UHY6_9MICC|nr:histidinol-phosphate transaminase [Nesterenkonia alkaliphila]MVT26083.1 aminotransferase class I/II-fold pyridoxal phosphate-dependent enzyme [Nesterenkonia alkaliphila]GFZ79364.1 putative phenylalanine aminotransferase [Nesterenkonia alkaliphila]